MKSVQLLQVTIFLAARQFNEAKAAHTSTLRGSRTSHVGLSEHKKEERILQDSFPIINESTSGNNKGKKPDTHKGKKPKMPDLISTTKGVSIKDFLPFPFFVNKDTDNVPEQISPMQPTGPVIKETTGTWEEVESENQVDAAPRASTFDPLCAEGLHHIEIYDEHNETKKTHDYYLNKHNGHCVVIDLRCPPFYREDLITYSDCAPDCLLPDAENPC